MQAQQAGISGISRHQLQNAPLKDKHKMHTEMAALVFAKENTAYRSSAIGGSNL
jgi:hypothetical protein